MKKRSRKSDDLSRILILQSNLKALWKSVTLKLSKHPCEVIHAKRHHTVFHIESNYHYPPSLLKIKLKGFRYKFTARCSFLMYHEKNLFFFFSYNSKSADVNIPHWIALADRPYLRHIHAGN